MADGGFSAGEENPEKIKKSRDKNDEPIIDGSDILKGILSIRFTKINLSYTQKTYHY
jgi:hypothetical protein